MKVVSDNFSAFVERINLQVSEQFKLPLVMASVFIFKVKRIVFCMTLHTFARKQIKFFVSYIF